MADPRSFLGRGMAYPFRFTRKTGGVNSAGVVSQSEDTQHINESILQILGIRVGSRVMRRSYGLIFGRLFSVQMIRLWTPV